MSTNQSDTGLIATARQVAIMKRERAQRVPDRFADLEADLLERLAQRIQDLTVEAESRQSDE